MAFSADVGCGLSSDGYNSRRWVGCGALGAGGDECAGRVSAVNNMMNCRIT